MELTFLGTSTVVPGGEHDTASMLLNGRYLIDTGWYAPIRMKRYGFDPMELEALFLTHCHHDHYIALPQVLFYLCMRAREKPDRPPLKIIGPAEDLERVIELSLRFLQADRFPAVNYDPELYPMEPGDTYDDETLHVETCPTAHPVEGLCYRITETKTGITCAVTGDTAYHPPIVEHVHGVALLVHEASYGPNPAPEENTSLHAGAPDAARVALEADVGRLALIHCPEDRQEEALAAAREIFPNTIFPADGETLTID